MIWENVILILYFSILYMQKLLHVFNTCLEKNLNHIIKFVYNIRLCIQLFKIFSYNYVCTVADRKHPLFRLVCPRTCAHMCACARMHTRTNPSHHYLTGIFCYVSRLFTLFLMCLFSYVQVYLSWKLLRDAVKSRK